MYPAVQGLIVAAVIQTIGTRLLTGKFEKLHLWILALTIVLGGMTLLFRDPVFVIWKASAVAWLTAAVLLYQQIVSKKPLIEQLMQTALEDEKLDAPEKVWKQINFAWPIGYFLFGFVNLYVAFNYTEAFWVKFKLFGLMGLTLSLMAFTLFKLFPYLPLEEEEKESDTSLEQSPPANTDSKEQQ